MRKQTIFFEKKPKIISTNTIVGPKEGIGPLNSYFDKILDNDKYNQKTFEKSESFMQMYAIKHAMENVGLVDNDIGALISGDLINEIIASSFSAKEFSIPYMGIYGACSTFGEGLTIGSTLVSGGFLDKVIVAASSHYSSIERQYRFPLELGTQPTPTSQWTVTGAGCCILSADCNDNNCPEIDCATIGKVTELGIDDANNMGAAMAPAAVDTTLAHFKDTGRDFGYYDMVLTGDLGRFGRSIYIDMMAENGFTIRNGYNDCGALIYEENKKAVQGGSGAGCATVVFNSLVYKKMKEKKLRKVLLIPTGALLSKVSALQGEAIPCIAHAVSISI